MQEGGNRVQNESAKTEDRGERTTIQTPYLKKECLVKNGEMGKQELVKVATIIKVREGKSDTLKLFSKKQRRRRG